MSAMNEAAKYSAVERLRDGHDIEIRALRPADEADMLAAVDRTSTQSLYRRFFGAKRHFSESEKSFFLNADFVNHVALVAVAKEGSRNVIVGGGRYIVVRPGTAELAFAVVDEYQARLRPPWNDGSAGLTIADFLFSLCSPKRVALKASGA
jgi:hypothetical protein